jgi:hypothetical protein
LIGINLRNPEIEEIVRTYQDAKHPFPNPLFYTGVTDVWEGGSTPAGIPEEVDK